MNFDLKSILRRDWKLLGVTLFLLFCWCSYNYEQARPMRELSESLRKVRQDTCALMRKQSDQAEYERECKEFL